MPKRDRREILMQPDPNHQRLIDFLQARYDEERERIRSLRTLASAVATADGAALDDLADHLERDLESKQAILAGLGHTLLHEIGWDGMDEFVLEHMATPYRHHQDYDTRWSPDAAE